LKNELGLETTKKQEVGFTFFGENANLTFLEICLYAFLPVENKLDKILNHEGHEGHKVFSSFSIFIQIRLVNRFSKKT
jgi:hypothetical protein